MDKLTANELRIGNYAKRIDDSEFIISANDILRLSESHLYLKAIPIPLTEEWLIRMGAVDLDAVHYKQYRLGERLIIVRDGKFVDYGSSVILEYVHTFQNFIYALTGNELTIKTN
jgi:hypothetical protein